GWCRNEVLGRSAVELGIWTDHTKRAEAVSLLLSEGSIRDLEFRYRRKDGTERVGLGSAELIDIDNEQCILSVIADVTERKEAEEALAEMSRKLIQAQEQERTRIGRELHDDINQRLAMLALELGRLQDNHPEVGSRVQELRKQTTEISNDVQALSHDLHSSKLEYLGVVAGIKSWCEEFAERQKMEIDFRNDVSSDLPFEVGVCLFRVLQEAMHNAVKHSGVKHIEVQMTERSDEVHLIITDSGRGFDVEAALHGKGLGLTSMRERVRLVNGTIAIESKPLGGTRIHLQIPLTSEQTSHRKAV